MLHYRKNGKNGNDKGVDPTKRKLFDIRPIQEMGSNIFRIVKKGGLGGIDEFFVKVRFNFWTKHPIEIINVNLAYDLSTALSGPQKISFDHQENVYEEMDAFYRMKKRKKIKDVSYIFISRRFTCEAGAENREYGQQVTIDFEISASAWDGIKVLTFKGKLQTGGELECISLVLHNGA
ncbi:MAG: hypothetical protein PVH61_33560 [Candidatus Aminicenantes bacterium]